MHPNVRRPQGRPRTLWRDDISHLAWECPSIHQEELENISGDYLVKPSVTMNCPWISGRTWMNSLKRHAFVVHVQSSNLSIHPCNWMDATDQQLFTPMAN